METVKTEKVKTETVKTEAIRTEAKRTETVKTEAIETKAVKTETILQVRNLSYEYESGRPALKNVTLGIKAGEKIAVIGANGAGKSTFFLSLNGVLRSDKGSIFYRGEEMTKRNLNLFRKNIGIVFQDADNQIIASTVAEEVSFGPMNLKLPAAEVAERVDQALERMGLKDFRTRPPHYLSGGEKKRVSIADIIAMDPEIFIFDEPTVALDPVNAAMLEDVLQKLSDGAKTVMVSTHDVDFAYRFADRIIVFADGEIIADGAPEEIFEDAQVIKRANLRTPVLLEVVKALRETGESGCFKEGLHYPKTVSEFWEMVGSPR